MGWWKQRWIVMVKFQVKIMEEITLSFVASFTKCVPNSYIMSRKCPASTKVPASRDLRSERGIGMLTSDWTLPIDSLNIWEAICFHIVLTEDRQSLKPPASVHLSCLHHPWQIGPNSRMALHPYDAREHTASYPQGEAPFLLHQFLCRLPAPAC